MGERRKEEEKEKVEREGEETLIPTLRDPPLSRFFLDLHQMTSFSFPILSPALFLYRQEYIFSGGNGLIRAGRRRQEARAREDRPLFSSSSKKRGSKTTCLIFFEFFSTRASFNPPLRVPLRVVSKRAKTQH